MSVAAWLHPSLAADYDALWRRQDKLGPVPLKDLRNMSEAQTRIFAEVMALMFFSHELFAGRSLSEGDEGMMERYEAFLKTIHRPQ